MVRMCSCLLIVVFGCMTLFAAATEVSLSGTVMDTANKAVAGASVTLVKQYQLKTTTNDQGAFTLSGPIVGIRAPFAISIQNSIKLGIKGKCVQFSVVAEGSDGRITIFSNSGRKVADIPLTNVKAGMHLEALPQLAAGFYIMSITIDQLTTTRKLINTGTTMYVNDNEVGVQNEGGIAKIAASAALDELVVTKTGYLTTKQQVTEYTKTGITVVLKAAPVGVGCSTPMPKFPAASALTYSNAKHPDAFTFKFMNQDNPKVTTKAQWACRQAEISAMAQEYLYGHLPPKPESVTGTVSGGKISISCKQGSKTASFSVNASGSGSILVVEFGMGAPKPSGSRSCGLSDQQSNMRTLYGSEDVGTCMAAAWGVGRIIDVLELNPTGGIDATKVVTTGCSTNGKLALISGVFEPRVAICMPVESGCCGTTSWRVSSEYGHGDSNTDCQDITHLEQDWLGSVASPWRGGNPKIAKLPFDQGEVMAVRAPGATMAYNNFHDWMWLCSKGNVAAAQSCHWIYKTLGVSDNFGFAEPTATHNHCSFPSSLNSTATAFYDKFLNGKADANTKVMQWYSGSQETSKWFEFGSGKDQWDTTLVLQ